MKFLAIPNVSSEWKESWAFQLKAPSLTVISCGLGINAIDWEAIFSLGPEQESNTKKTKKRTNRIPKICI